MESPPAPARGWRACLADGLLVLLLLGLTWKLTYSISSVRDLGLCDEATYMQAGVAIPEDGLPPAQGCPLHGLWYLGLSQFQPDRVQLYYLSWSLLVALLAAGFYLLVRTLGGTRPAALLASFLLLTSSLVDIYPYPSHLATVVLVFGCALAVRVRPVPLALAVLGLTLLLVGYTRPEYFVAFLLFCLVGLAATLVALWRCPRRWRLLGACVLLVGVPATLAARIAGVPLGGDRSFYAFGQHYAYNVSRARPLAVNPMYHWELVVREDFGAAQSLGEALCANPRAVLWHIGANIRSLPQSLSLVAAPNLNVSPQLSRVIGLGMLAALLLGGAGVWRRLPSWRQVSGENLPPREADDGRRLLLALTLLTLVLLPAAASCLLVFPRLHYLMPPATLALALAAGSLPGRRAFAPDKRLGSRPALLALSAALVLLTPNRAGRPWDVQSWLRRRPAPAAPVLTEQRTVAVLRSLRLAEPVVILDATLFSRAFYAMLCGQPAQPMTTADGGFEDFLRRRGVNVVVLDAALDENALLRADVAFRRFAAGRQADGFTRFDVPGCRVQIAVRNDVLPPPLRLTAPPLRAILPRYAATVEEAR